MSIWHVESLGNRGEEGLLASNDFSAISSRVIQMLRNYLAGLQFIILNFSKIFALTSITALEADCVHESIMEMSCNEL
jgi:hypothetical protein